MKAIPQNVCSIFFLQQIICIHCTKSPFIVWSWKWSGIKKDNDYFLSLFSGVKHKCLCETSFVFPPDGGALPCRRPGGTGRRLWLSCCRVEAVRTESLFFASVPLWSKLISSAFFLFFLFWIIIKFAASSLHQRATDRQLLAGLEKVVNILLTLASLLLMSFRLHWNLPPPPL